MSSVLVIGSSNTDMVIRVDQLPRPGQTVLGGKFQTFNGGKGANQAIAARRAGADVRFIAAVGDDELGQSAIALFANEQIDTNYVQVIKDAPSGVALIFVSSDGENSIGVAPGANDRLTPASLCSADDAYDDADVLLIQLETPMETVAAAVDKAAQRQLPVILNPAPAMELPASVLGALFCISPNESEAELLTGIVIDDRKSAVAAAEALLQKGVENVVITMGASGALLHNADGTHFQPAETVEVVDTTGAGDTFNGVLAAMVAKGNSMQQAIATAVTAASISVQSAGAIPSIPTLDQ